MLTDTEPEGDMTLAYMKGYQDGQDELLALVNAVRGLDSKWKLKDIGGPYQHGFVAVFVDTTNDSRPLDHSDFLNGTGPTRVAAIKAAVAAAKEAQP